MSKLAPVETELQRDRIKRYLVFTRPTRMRQNNSESVLRWDFVTVEQS